MYVTSSIDAIDNLRQYLEVMVFVLVLEFDFVFVLIFDFVFVFEKKEACCQPLHLLYARGGKDARGRAGGSATQMHSLGPFLGDALYCIVLYCITMHSLGPLRCIQKNFPRIETLWNVSGWRKGNLNLVCKHAFDQVNIIRLVA